jgi:rhodanese-related sulfurtransferase
MPREEDPMNKRLTVWIVGIAVIVGVMYSLSTPAPAIKKLINGQELAQLQTKGAWVIDVRSNSEFVSGHLPNSLNVPLDQLGQVSSTWPKTQPVIVYCATGARSAEAAAYLAAQGFRKVYDLDKGIASWTGQVVGGQDTAALPTGAGVVKTSGKPVFIDFASST